MLNAIIDWSARNRFLVLLATLFVVLAGIFAILRTIHADGVTIVLVEQNARMALSVADRALVMEHGRFVLDGTAAEIAADPDVQEFYLGVATEEAGGGLKRYRRKKRWR